MSTSTAMNEKYTSPAMQEALGASVSQGETDVLEQIDKYSSIVLCCVGLLSNSIIIATLVKTNKSKLSTNVYFMAIAIFDNLYLLISLVDINVYHNGNSYAYSTKGDDTICKIIFLVWSTSTFSVHAQTALACDRCYVLINPYKPKPTRKNALICICIIVLSSLCFYTPGTILVGHVDAQSFRNVSLSNSTEKVCDLKAEYESHSQFYVSVNFIFGTLAPFITITVANILVIEFLKKQKNQIHSFGQQSNRITERRITQKIIAINCFYVLCILPTAVYYALSPFMFSGAEEAFTKNKIYNGIYFLFTANFSLNLYLFLWSSRQFRADVKKMFTSRCG